jgi:hypothetical protein
MFTCIYSLEESHILTINIMYVRGNRKSNLRNHMSFLIQNNHATSLILWFRINTVVPGQDQNKRSFFLELDQKLIPLLSLVIQKNRELQNSQTSHKCIFHNLQYFVTTLSRNQWCSFALCQWIFLYSKFKRLKIQSISVAWDCSYSYGPKKNQSYIREIEKKST